jgi:hypothetical protein
MTIEEKLREIMLSEELSGAEKLDRLHALIPAETFKIDSPSTATPAQVRLLRDGLMVTDAMEKSGVPISWQKKLTQRPPRASVKCGEETVAIEDVVTVGAAVSSSAWLGVFISAPAKSTPTRIELYPREFVFCPYRDVRVKGLRIIERRYCHVNPFRTDFVLDKQRRATTRGERA